MKYFSCGLLFLFSHTAFSQQAPSIETLIKKYITTEILPVRKPVSPFTAPYYRLKNGAIIGQISYMPSLSPFRSLTYEKHDDEQLSTLALSVKTYMASLKNEKKK